MWSQFTDPALAAMSGGYELLSRIEIWHSSSPVYVLEAIDGQVEAVADRAVRRNLSCSLVDTTEKMTRGDVDDLLNPYDCELAVFTGVRYTASVLGVPVTYEEFSPQGVFGLTGRNVQDTPDKGVTISVDGQDRTIGYQVPMSSVLSIAAGTPVEVAVEKLLLRVNPGLALDAMVTGFTCGPLIFKPDIDVWQEASDLAKSVGAVLYHDRQGNPVLGPAGPPSMSSVASYEEGDGLLMSLTRSEDSDSIKNVVVAESKNGLIHVEVADLNPLSPTYAKGQYKRRVAPLISQHFSSIAQATQAALAQLDYELGRQETVAFTCIPNLELDVNEVISVDRPRSGLVQRGLVTASTTLNLSVKEKMSVKCRSSVLAQDGRVLPVQPVTVS